jgi:hypothetical protein
MRDVPWLQHNSSLSRAAALALEARLLQRGNAAALLAAGGGVGGGSPPASRGSPPRSPPRSPPPPAAVTLSLAAEDALRLLARARARGAPRGAPQPRPLPYVPYGALLDADQSLSAFDFAALTGGVSVHRDARDLAAPRWHAHLGNAVDVDAQGGAFVEPLRGVAYGPTDAAGGGGGGSLGSSGALGSSGETGEGSGGGGGVGAPPSRALRLRHVYGFSGSLLPGQPILHALQPAALRLSPGVPDVVYALGSAAVVISLGAYGDVEGARAVGALGGGAGGGAGGGGGGGGGGGRSGGMAAAGGGDGGGVEADSFSATNPMWSTEGAGGGGGSGDGGPAAPARTQRLYTGHSASLTAVAAHPVLPLVATAQLPEAPLRPGDEGFSWRRCGVGEGGGGACVRVWHAGSCADASPPLRVPPEAGALVASLSFSPCGRHLLAVAVAGVAAAAAAGGAPATATAQHTLLLWTLYDGGGSEEACAAAPLTPAALGLPAGTAVTSIVPVARGGAAAAAAAAAPGAAQWLLLTTAGAYPVGLSSGAALQLLPRFLGLPGGAAVVAAACCALGGEGEGGALATTALALASGELLFAADGEVAARVEFDPPAPIRGVWAVPHQPVAGLPSPPTALFAVARGDGSLAVVQCERGGSGGSGGGGAGGTPPPRLAAALVLTVDLCGRMVDVAACAAVPVPEVVAEGGGGGDRDAPRVAPAALLLAMALGTADGALLRGTCELPCTERGVLASCPAAAPLGGEGAGVGGGGALVVEVLEQQPASATTLAAHPSLPLFAVGDGAGRVQLWDSRRRVLLGELSVPESAGVAAALPGSPSPRLAGSAVGAGGSFRRKPAAAGASKWGAGGSLSTAGRANAMERALAVPRAVTALCWAHDGRVLHVALAPHDGGEGAHAGGGPAAPRGGSAAAAGSPRRTGGGGSHLDPLRMPALVALVVALPSPWLWELSKEAPALAPAARAFTSAALAGDAIAAWRAAHPPPPAPAGFKRGGLPHNTAAGLVIPAAPAPAALLTVAHATLLPLLSGSSAHAALAAAVEGALESAARDAPSAVPPRGSPLRGGGGGGGGAGAPSAEHLAALLAALRAPVCITSLRVAPRLTTPGGTTANPHHRRLPAHRVHVVAAGVHEELRAAGSGAPALADVPVGALLSSAHPDDLVHTLALGTSGGTVEVVTVDATAPPAVAPPLPDVHSPTAALQGGGGPEGGNAPPLPIWRRKTLRLPHPALNHLLAQLGPVHASLLAAHSVTRVDWDVSGRYLAATASTYQVHHFDCGALGGPLRSLATLRDVNWATHSGPLAWGALGAHRRGWDGPPLRCAGAPPSPPPPAAGGARVRPPALAAAREPALHALVQCLAVARSGGGGELAAGGADGVLRLFSFPANAPAAPARAYRAPHALTGGPPAVGVAEVEWAAAAGGFLSLAVAVRTPPYAAAYAAGASAPPAARRRGAGAGAPPRGGGEEGGAAAAAAAAALAAAEAMGGAACVLADWELCPAEEAHFQWAELWPQGAEAECGGGGADAPAAPAPSPPPVSGPPAPAPAPAPAPPATPPRPVPLAPASPPLSPRALPHAPAGAAGDERAASAASLLRRYDAALAAVLAEVAESGYRGPARVAAGGGEGAPGSPRMMDAGVLYRRRREGAGGEAAQPASARATAALGSLLLPESGLHLPAPQAAAGAPPAPTPPARASSSAAAAAAPPPPPPPSPAAPAGSPAPAPPASPEGDAIARLAALAARNADAIARESAQERQSEEAAASRASRARSLSGYASSAAAALKRSVGEGGGGGARKEGGGGGGGGGGGAQQQQHHPAPSPPAAPPQRQQQPTPSPPAQERQQPTPSPSKAPAQPARSVANTSLLLDSDED